MIFIPTRDVRIISRLCMMNAMRIPRQTIIMILMIQTITVMHSTGLNMCLVLINLSNLILRKVFLLISLC